MFRKKIAILGSTGSIGKTFIEIIKKDKKNFDIQLLSAHQNYKQLINQAKELGVKNLVITNQKSFHKVKSDKKYKNINIYSNFKIFNKIFKKKIDYVMSSIIGIDGLEPTLNSIKFTKNILIANKESLICGWNLISSELKKNKTRFIPIDSEHFSIWSLIDQNKNIKNIEKVYITASGGSFLNLPLKHFSKIQNDKALIHPNWKMGKKITVDSSTMMNKVFEVIEAKNIFGLNYNQIEILIHPNSYAHAIIKFYNGIIKVLLHETSMKIPIYNSIYINDYKNKITTDNLDLHKLNNLDLRIPEKKRYPILKILNKLVNTHSLYETALVKINDNLVKKFLEKKINYNQLVNLIIKFANKKEFLILRNKPANNIEKIKKIMKLVDLKINALDI
jgi:1-deoxy-D-xylulose-5-phosphate reductoisomerase